MEATPLTYLHHHQAPPTFEHNKGSKQQPNWLDHLPAFFSFSQAQDHNTCSPPSQSTLTLERLVATKALFSSEKHVKVASNASLTKALKDLPALPPIFLHQDLEEEVWSRQDLIHFFEGLPTSGRR
ncbi:hypothetical protein LOK49_LG15G00808 [Camellia lanceoleosa]|uniref:Uncharacterized protein n=1 Tax=Camellia lanceoleosa TaxID=1840588 RepID=A0ACC0F5B7_9ERIC|nr:hypothetical protein LOK49_LG15G00808 [Camellia lanceoleosa]